MVVSPWWPGHATHHLGVDTQPVSRSVAPRTRCLATTTSAQTSQIRGCSGLLIRCRRWWTERWSGGPTSFPGEIIQGLVTSWTGAPSTPWTHMWTSGTSPLTGGWTTWTTVSLVIIASSTSTMKNWLREATLCWGVLRSIPSWSQKTKAVWQSTQPLLVLAYSF